MCNESNHSYFVAEVIAVEGEGMIYVPTVCTRCGDYICHESKVGTGSIRLLKENKKENS